MKKIVLSMIIIGIFLVVSVNFSVAVASSTWVNFTVHPYNYSLNNSFNGKISGLQIRERDNYNIVWEWENSADEAFSYNLVFLNNILVANGTLENFSAVGLEGGKCYRISVISISDKGIEGPVVVENGCTLQLREHKRVIHRNGAITTRETIPNFFSKEKKAIVSGNIDIVLNKFPAKESEPISLLILWILVSLIFVLIILIIINLYVGLVYKKSGVEDNLNS